MARFCQGKAFGPFLKIVTSQGDALQLHHLLKNYSAFSRQNVSILPATCLNREGTPTADFQMNDTVLPVQRLIETPVPVL